MPKGEGNGQGNFTSGGRNTKPLRKIMQKQNFLEKERKKNLRLQNFLVFRELNKRGGINVK